MITQYSAISTQHPFDWGRFLRQSDIVLAVAVISIVGLLIVPLPTPLLDVLLVLNMAAALLVLMVCLYTREPLQFSTFPSLLLILTLARLTLNISSSRLILLQGDAGRVIEAFGTFVVGGNYVVGVIIFSILAVIQFVVITNGAGRISEVAARFTLDAMPGKQMSIDADLNAGLIDEATARARRRAIEREADFYGTMDGASKFVKGDAIAGLVIVLVNIAGGFIVGIWQHRLSMLQALQTYTILTVGDGLVTQIPALIISIATGLLVSRAASDLLLSEDMGRQIFQDAKALLIVGSVVFLLGLVPGLPHLPFLFIGTVAIAGGWLWRPAQTAPAQPSKDPAGAPARGPEDMKGLLKIDTLELEIGYRLIPLVSPEQGGDLLQRITNIRRQTALSLGLLLPPIRVRDNGQLKPRAYAIKLRQVEIARGEVPVDGYLAMATGSGGEPLEGTRVTDPVFGLPALWIADAQRERAERLGYTLFDPATVIATHLTEAIKAHAADLLSRQSVQELLDMVRKDHPAIVEDLIPILLSAGDVQRVLQSLLRERVPIRDLVTVLEALGQIAREVKDIDALSEHARQALARTLCQQHQNGQGELAVVTLSPAVEQLLAGTVTRSEGRTTVYIDPAVAQRLIQELGREMEKWVDQGHVPIMLCSPPVRLILRRLTERALPQLVILSYNELIPRQVEVKTLGVFHVEGL